MTFARPTAEQKAAGAKWDKTRIIYNSHITLASIPLEAYDYVVNGKPAIEWIMERYQVTRDKDSGIVNDPNDWCREHNQPRYIIDLIEARGPGEPGDDEDRQTAAGTERAEGWFDGVTTLFGQSPTAERGQLRTGQRREDSGV